MNHAGRGTVYFIGAMPGDPTLGTRFRGHEFHSSTIEPLATLPYAKRTHRVGRGA